MRFKDKLRELRHDAEMTQEDLAHKAGLALSTLRGLEQGQRLPSWGAVVRLARTLGVSSGVFDDCDEVQGAGRLRKRGKAKGK